MRTVISHRDCLLRPQVLFFLSKKIGVERVDTSEKFILDEKGGRKGAKANTLEENTQSLYIMKLIAYF